MKTLSKLLSLFLFVCALIAGDVSDSHAWTHNEYPKNNTGGTAYDFIKVLDGDYNITSMMRGTPFRKAGSSHRPDGSGGIETVLKWWDGTVPPNVRAGLCFHATRAMGNQRRAKIIYASWTDASGAPLFPPVKALSVSVDFDETSVDYQWNFNGNLENNLAAGIEANTSNPDWWSEGDFELIGEADPITVVSLRGVVIDGALTPETLTLENLETNYGYPGAFTEYIGATTVIYGNPIPFDCGGVIINSSQSLVLVADQGDGNYDFFNFGAPSPAVPVPATASIGTAGLAALLVIVGAVAIVRSRKASTLLGA
jgi:hypothetical protein